MKVVLNGEPADIQQRTLNQLFTSLFPDCDVAIIDGKEAKGHVVLKEKMNIYIGKSPSSKGDLSEALTARDPAGYLESLRNATVGIAGAGGLGSNIASLLVRAGVGSIVIADFDKVDLSNLNRQNYFVGDLGYYKVDAISRHLSGMNPNVKVEAHKVRLDEKNIPKIFSKCDVICEAFDTAEGKAMILDTVAEKLPDTPLVCGSGMSGTSDPSDMVTKKFSDNVYICGDGRTTPADGLLSTRVVVCAGLMANKVLQLLTHSEQDV